MLQTQSRPSTQNAEKLDKDIFTNAVGKLPDRADIAQDRPQPAHLRCHCRDIMSHLWAVVEMAQQGMRSKELTYAKLIAEQRLGAAVPKSVKAAVTDFGKSNRGGKGEAQLGCSQRSSSSGL